MTMRHKHLLLAGGGTAVLLIGLVVGIYALGVSSHTVLLAGLKVGTVDVGSLDPAAARTKLSQAVEALAEVPVKADGETTVVRFEDFGITVATDRTVAAARNLNSQSNPWLAGWNRLRSFVRPLTIPAIVDVDAEKFNPAAASFLNQINEEEHNATLERKDGQWQVVQPQAGKELSQQSFETALLAHVAGLRKDLLILTPRVVQPAVSAATAQLFIAEAERKTADPIILKAPNETVTIAPDQLAAWIEIRELPAVGDRQFALTLNADKVRAYIITLGDRFDTEPVNARVVFSDGVVRITQDSKDGQRLDQDAAVNAVLVAYNEPQAERTIILPFKAVTADVASSTLANLGLKELIGTATTNFAGSPDNRRHNIANGLKFLAGKLIKPGEQFSTVGSLGQVDGSTGYLPELVIKENRTVPEYGGGLCQVSTTLFRSALNAGLQITERRNHSYRVSYYEKGVGPGLDATIYLPSPDLKFLNDTPGWILIQGTVNQAKSEITFELYGTSDGRRSEVGKPVILSTTSAPAPIYVETADLPAGTTKQLEKPHDGAKTTVSYRVYRNNQLIHSQDFASSYKAWAARYLVGKGGTPTEPSPSPTPTETTSTPTPTPTETTPAP